MRAPLNTFAPQNGIIHMMGDATFKGQPFGSGRGVPCSNFETIPFCLEAQLTERSGGYAAQRESENFQCIKMMQMPP